jgi:signal transduction histidine kinase
MKFTVDSALLEELGERLIGRPYIAIAELVKNSYDADASKARIDLNLATDNIVVADDGQGMTVEEFERFWMRVGSQHKKGQFRSRKLGRPLTGYKGIGRLAVQFLSRELVLATVSDWNPKKRLTARVRWDEAVKAGDLTEATVEYDLEDGDFKHGTMITLKGLKQEWSQRRVGELAEEIWQLQSPFIGSSESDPKYTFEIDLRSQDQRMVVTFRDQLQAIQDVWTARLRGKNEEGTVKLVLEYNGEKNPTNHSYSIPDNVLLNGSFDIKIYLLKSRKPRGIKVKQARDYFEKFGGVHVYDGGFRLPFYGGPKNDWLGLEIAHSHRLSISQLLPKEMRVDRGLQDLPTNSRIYGIVDVDSSKEPGLKPVITRDRFQEGRGFEALAFMVRYALDFYAYEERKRRLIELAKEAKTEPFEFESIDEVLAKVKGELPETRYAEVRDGVQAVVLKMEKEVATAGEKLGLMAALATAGLSTVAYQHELKQQFRFLDGLVENLDRIGKSNPALSADISPLHDSLSQWLDRARTTNALFSYLAAPSSLKVKKRFKAKELVDQVKRQVAILARDTEIETKGIIPTVLLPHGTFAEWSSIFQNVFINAFNATLDSPKKQVDVSLRVRGGEREILVQDTGVGLDLRSAETMFEPFERRMKISPERQSLGYGGSGLGLTIVKMIAENLGCEVSFVAPTRGFSTAFSLRWREVYEE